MKTTTTELSTFNIIEQKVIIRLNNRVCESADEILDSELCREIIKRAIASLQKRNSFLLGVFENNSADEKSISKLIEVLKHILKMPLNETSKVVSGSERFFKDPYLLNEFVEYLYNYWRSFDRFLISYSNGENYDQKPFRTFNSTIGHLTTIIRGMYRDIQENITGQHPRVYRQVTAGAEVSTISATMTVPFNAPEYEQLNKIPVIRQILLYPPLILNPPMNKRTGKFEKVNQNPINGLQFKSDDWLCYPAKVGELVILIYFHNKFSDLGHSLCNLFQLADDEDLKRKPDAIYFYGVEGDSLDKLGNYPTVFYEDNKNDMLVAGVPGRNEFGYFGYLKKMVLTLHNVIMIKRQRLPFHGALVRIILKGNHDKTILFIGDTGAGKSETLEAFRELGEEYIQDIIIIADDMGSLEIAENGDIIGYGTEIGAFLRLDDLQPGYALGQIDRAIIMSANQVNARIIIPVTSFENVIKGHKIDFILYANNYDEIDEEHPLIERIKTPDQAINIFREGTVMSKGTTSSTGLVHSYFANIFGPPSYKPEHDALAKQYFEAFFAANLFIGQMRTRLGLSGWERNGPVEAAKELLNTISK